jgi:hypothetical protein
MKKAIFTLLFALYGVMLSAQVPQKLGYQMLVLDPKVGTVLKTQDVNVELQIRQGSADGTVVYTYKNTEHTNRAGICYIVLDTPASIDWSNGPFFLATFVNDRMLSCTQLLSVPFAFQADKATTVNAWPTETQLVGKWARDDGDETITFTFNSDKTATRVKTEDDPDYSSENYTETGTWELLPGNILHLSLLGEESTKGQGKYDYCFVAVVKNGSLYIAGDEHNEGTYVKQ